jgi:uncharacterized membrane protein YagU involved in acid resistance
MDLGSATLWGLIATLALTTLMQGAQGLGLSRMSIPFILGMILTPNRNTAPILGFAIQCAIGWAVAIVYALVFESLGTARWWLGGLMGLAHGIFILVAVLPLLPGVHPRMASEHHGPEPTGALEPPGFLALNYGRRTPLVTLVAHMLYGVVLGAFYQLAG